MNETIEFTLRKDPLYQQAVDLIIESKRISPSYLQRRLKISYRRAELLCSAVIESLMAKYSDHIATSGKMIRLTTEQAQQIEEALVATLKNNDYWLEKCTGALDTIRAARAQERETVVCESCGETIPECQIAGETESGGVACTGCVVSYLENRASALENRASAIATAVMTDNQYHDSLLRDRDYLLAVLEEIADDIWSRYGCKKVAEEAIAKVKEGKAESPVDHVELSLLRPSNWTREMSDAWHRAIPNLEKAFDDLIAAYNKGRNK